MHIQKQYFAYYFGRTEYWIAELRSHEMTKNDLEKKLERTQISNQKLQKKVKQLEKKVKNLQEKLSEDIVVETSQSGKKIKKEKDTKISEEWSDRSRNRKRYSKKTMTGFVVSTVTNSSLYSIFYKITVWFKKISFLSTVLIIIKAILTAISTSAIFILFLVVLIPLLPFILIAALVSCVHTLLSFKKYNEKFRSLIQDKKLLVFFPSKNDSFDPESYLGKTFSTLSDKNTAIIAVTPYFFSSKGFGGKGGFLTCRHEMKNVYIVRRRYFFIFKRRVIKNANCETIYIY